MCALLRLFPALPSVSPASRGAFLVGNWQGSSHARVPGPCSSTQAPAWVLLSACNMEQAPTFSG